MLCNTGLKFAAAVGCRLGLGHTEQGGVTFIEVADPAGAAFESEVEVYQREVHAPNTTRDTYVLSWWQEHGTRSPLPEPLPHGASILGLPSFFCLC